MPRGLVAPVMMAALDAGFLMLIVAFIRTGIFQCAVEGTDCKGLSHSPVVLAQADRQST